MKINKLYLIFLCILILIIAHEIVGIKNNLNKTGFVTINFVPSIVKTPKIFFIDANNPCEAQFILSNNEPKIVFLSGSIVFPTQIYENTKIGSNTMLIGIGKTAKILNSGLDINGTNNITIRNIEFKNAPDDAITIEEGAHHVWIDHCVFDHAEDGLCDIVTGSDYITLSWNIFKNQRKTILIGNSDKAEEIDKNHLHVTLHHNWFINSKARLPRVRFGKVHVFNNYYENIETGARSTKHAEVLLENNAFYRVDYPSKIDFKGTNYGALQAKGNISINCRHSLIHGGKVFNPKDYYNYSINNALLVPLIVKMKAGLL